MNPSINKIVLDLHKSESQANIFIRQGDTARKLYFIFTDGGNPFELTDCTAVLRAEKPDGNMLFNNCEIVGNTAVYTVTAQTSASNGIAECEIKLFDINNTVISTPRFTITVTESLNNAEEITSSNEFSALVQALAEVGGLEGRTNAAMAAARNLDASANESIALANETLNAANNINIWAGTNGNNAFIRVRRKDGTLQTLMVPGGSVIEYDEGSYDYSSIPSSDNPDESASWSDVNQAINIAINNLKSNYANLVQLGNQNAVTSDAVYNYISEQLSSAVLPDLTTQQIQTLIDNSINNKIGDEINASSNNLVTAEMVFEFVNSELDVQTQICEALIDAAIQRITDGDEVGW